MDNPIQFMSEAIYGPDISDMMAYGLDYYTAVNLEEQIIARDIGPLVGWALLERLSLNPTVH